MNEQIIDDLKLETEDIVAFRVKNHLK